MEAPATGSLGLLGEVATEPSFPATLICLVVLRNEEGKFASTHEYGGWYLPAGRYLVAMALFFWSRCTTVGGRPTACCGLGWMQARASPPVRCGRHWKRPVRMTYLGASLGAGLTLTYIWAPVADQACR